MSREPREPDEVNAMRDVELQKCIMAEFVKQGISSASEIKDEILQMIPPSSRSKYRSDDAAIYAYMELYFGGASSANPKAETSNDSKHSVVSEDINTMSIKDIVKKVKECGDDQLILLAKEALNAIDGPNDPGAAVAIQRMEKSNSYTV